MKKDLKLIKEIFENFGTLRLETVYPENPDFLKFLKDNFIEIKPHPKSFYPGLFTYTGTLSSLVVMASLYWSQSKIFVQKFFVKL